MICEACHGQQAFPPCPKCGGCGIAHCCDGLVECQSAGRPTSADKQLSTCRRDHTEDNQLVDLLARECHARLVREPATRSIEPYVC